MLPLGHLAFAYLWYVAYAVSFLCRLTARLALIPLAIGSQLPDLIDKPLAYVGLLTSGRSLAHSLFTFVLCVLGAQAAATRLRGRWAPESLPERLRIVTPIAFAIGYLSHLVGDSYRSLLAGDFWKVRFLLYPIYNVPRSPLSDIPPWTQLSRTYDQMDTHPESNLIILAAVVFVGARVRQYLRKFLAK